MKSISSLAQKQAAGRAANPGGQSGKRDRTLPPAAVSAGLAWERPPGFLPGIRRVWASHRAVTPHGPELCEAGAVRAPLLPCLIPAGGWHPAFTWPSLFVETTHEARGEPAPEAGAGLPNGAAQAEAVGSGHAGLLLQPIPAASARPEGTTAETSEVRWCRPEGARPASPVPRPALPPTLAPTERLSFPLTDRHAEGHQAQPETVPPARDRAQRWGLLSAVAPCLGWLPAAASASGPGAPGARASCPG